MEHSEKWKYSFERLVANPLKELDSFCKDYGYKAQVKTDDQMYHLTIIDKEDNDKIVCKCTGWELNEVLRFAWFYSNSTFRYEF